VRTPENTAIINVCALPDKATSSRCVEISRSLKPYNPLFMLGDGKFPHMTLFMARFDRDQKDNVIDGVGKTMRSAGSLLCRHTDYYTTPGRYFEASYEKSSGLVALHAALITNIADFRFRPGEPLEEAYFAPYNVEQQRNAEETGYDLAYRPYDLFRPHVTLTRYRENSVPEEQPSISPIMDLSFQLGKIGVYFADDNGAVYEQIHEFHIAS
jgi:hypothetical protein